MEDSTFLADVCPVIEHWARKVFAGDPDLESQVADSISVGWEFARRAPDTATASTLARFAVQRVKVRRQFRESERSIDKPIPASRERARRKGLPSDLVDPADDPAEIVSAVLDFVDWMESLSRRELTVAVASLIGDRTGEIAERLGVTPGAVSQTRRALAEDWLAFRS